MVRLHCHRSWEDAMWQARPNEPARAWWLTLGPTVVALAIAGPWLEGRADDVRDHENHGGTQTPIKHVIVLIGENHSFDNVFATYRPKHGRLVSNLLAKGIIRPDGSP